MKKEILKCFTYIILNLSLFNSFSHETYIGVRNYSGQSITFAQFSLSRFNNLDFNQPNENEFYNYIVENSSNNIWHEFWKRPKCVIR